MKMYVAGEWVDRDSRMDVIDPYAVKRSTPSRAHRLKMWSLPHAPRTKVGHRWLGSREWTDMRY